MMPLSAMPVNQTVSIVEIRGSRPFRRRLQELGFVPGTPLSIVGVAPLGDPLEVDIRSSRFSLRREEAASLIVRL